MLSLNTTTWNPMRLEFLDMQEKDNPLNGALIDSKEELVRILEQLRHRQPFGLKLKGENGFTLDICLAREFGSLQHSASSGDTPYLMAVAPGSSPILSTGVVGPYALACMADEKNGAEPPEFLVGGTPTPIPTRYCLPFELVKEIAVCFLKSGDRDSRVVWESI
jgi:hypothetical protein